MSVILDGEQLTLAEVVRVARGDERVEVAAAALDRVRAARAVVERAVAGTDGVYGVTTGVGVRKRVRVESDEMDAYNRRLLRDHRMATGPDAPREVVRAAMVRLANGFAKGTSGRAARAPRRASSTRSTPARRRACACSDPRARAISARSPTSPSGSAATCPWPPRRASR